MKKRGSLRVFIFTFLISLEITSCNSSEEKKDLNPDSLNAKRSLEKDLPPGEIEKIFLAEGFVDIQTLDSTIAVDLKYSTTDNFMKRDMYGTLTKCYLHPKAAEKLLIASKSLREKNPGYKFICYDCARPANIQKLMWDSLDIPFKANYLTPPWKGSVHNYGCAVDLSVLDEKGIPLDMGTSFDFFGEEAQPVLEASLLKSGRITEKIISNRKILKESMRAGGFSPILTEWWHYIAFIDTVVYKNFKIIK